MTKSKKLKILFVFQSFREGISEFYLRHIKRLNDAGFDVEGFCLTPNPPQRSYTFKELNSLFYEQYPPLMRMYGELKKKAASKDVLLLYNGANLHPSILPELHTFNVYQCFDDPESSHLLSKPVASAFDACFVGNIASIQQYIAWGCKNVFFRPLGYFYEHCHQFDDLRTVEASLYSRDIDVSLFCERISSWRIDRLDYLCSNLPFIYARGKGWPQGYVSDKEMLNVYARSKIGINIHNSTGPINLRLYTLPAMGIMQICDNRFFLGQLFDLGREVVGFQDIQEVPELVNFYLRNDTARKKIAMLGWRRTTSCYNEITIFQNQTRQIASCI